MRDRKACARLGALLPAAVALLLAGSARAQGLDLDEPALPGLTPPPKPPKARPGRARARPKPPKKTPKLRKGLLAECLAGPLADVEDVVFAVRPYGNDGHWYANFGYWSSDPDKKMYARGGRLCRLDLRRGKVTTLLADETGGIRDPQVHYGARRIVFSYRRGGREHYHLYEIGVDGTGLRQLTDGDCDDIEPTYLPGPPGRREDGGIGFCSSRCNRYVQCWFTQVAVLYRCEPDGSNVRKVSANVEHDNTPWPLPDGRVLFTRWEYVDRSQVRYHHLWTMNPDGTGQMIFFGNMHPGLVMIDAKPVPPPPAAPPTGSPKVLAVFSPAHGRRSHAGHLALINPDAGPDEVAFAPVLTDTADWRDPYPLSEDCFLVARDDGLYVMNARGEYEQVYRLGGDGKAPGPPGGMKLHEPRPLCRRRPERFVPTRTDWSQPNGRLVLADVTHGRNMEGVRAGEVRRLLVLETLPKPVNFSGGQDAVSPGGTFTIPRVLGTVPVEPDGSAYFEVPALRPVFFVALDENDLSVKRMQSFVSVMPGETTGCAGCHEDRTEAAKVRRVLPTRALAEGRLLATRRPPSAIRPIADVPDVLDFCRDVQPIIDKHCVRCHDGTKPDRPDLRNTRASRYATWPVSYTTLFRQVAEGRNADGNRAPRTIGSSASPLMRKVRRPGQPAAPSRRGAHRRAALSEREWRLIWLWVECGAHYPGTYASLGSGRAGMYGARDVVLRRCGDCHGHIAPDGSLQASFRAAGDEQWDLDEPEKSLMLRAPLAKAAGGLGLCRGEYTLFRDGTRSKARKPDAARRREPRPAGGLDLHLDDLLAKPAAAELPPAVDGPKSRPVRVVFAATSDPDYQALLAQARRGTPWRRRFDMPGFRPNDHYLREMKRYGILPADHKPEDPVDVYAVDRAYWRSFWYVPARPAGASP